MANYSEVTDILVNRFINNLPSIDGVTIDASSIKYPNAPFQTPKDTPWFRLSVIHGQSENVQTGLNGRTRQEGIFIIDCFFPTGTGNKSLNEIQTQMQDLYKRKVFESVRCKTFQPIEVGVESQDSNWYQLQIEVFFEFDDC